jgi:predicted nucleic acid-binding protein
MAEPRVYLDSSAIVKRYVNEKGTGTVDEIFKDAEDKKLIIVFSIWNITEVIVAFDKYERKKIIELKPTFDKFVNELKKLVNMGSIETVDASSRIIFDSIEQILRYHIYSADAIQIVSCKFYNCEKFFTADKELYNVAKKEGINSILL